MTRFLLPLALVVLLVPAPAHAQQTPRDQRDQFGTPSLECAQQLAKAIQLNQAKQPKDALPVIKAALSADPKCQMAHYWHALILTDLGEIPDAIAAYKHALTDEVTRHGDISADAAVNLAITLAKLKEHDEAHIWFTRAILEDPNNKAGKRGKAYRNLAISLGQEGKSLSAALAVAMAYRDKAPNTTLKMVEEYFAKAEDQESASLLFFGDKVPTVANRTEPNKLTPATVDGNPAAAIADVLADPNGRYGIALVNQADHYYFLKLDGKPSAVKVTAPGPIAAACLADGSLYTLCTNPARIEKLIVETGKSAASYPLKTNNAVTSMAVLPAHGLAFVCIDRTLHSVSLKTGAVKQTDIPGQVVVAHPNQRDLFSYLKPETRSNGGYIIINGRPVYFRSSVTDWQQTTVFRTVVSAGGLMMTELRENMASNAQRMSLSADGQWLAVAGGGGYRPNKPGPDGAGYGVAVFAAGRLEHLQGFFKTDAYPKGVCFNPATGQMAAIRDGDAKVYHLSDAKTPAVLTGKFTGAGAWSGDGRYLVLANAGTGVTLFENSLSDAEKQTGKTWQKTIKVEPIPGFDAGNASTSAATFEPVEALKTFTVAALQRAELAAQLDKALKEGRTTRSARWTEYPPYIQDAARKDSIVEAANMIDEKKDLGIATYKLKTVLKAAPDAAPAQFFLAAVAQAQEQSDEAMTGYVAVVHADAGRTELSISALNRMATLLTAKKQEMEALTCLTTSLRLDRGNPGTLNQTAALLKKNKFDAEADRVGNLVAKSPAVVAKGLPKLPKPPEPTKKLTAAEVYKQAVWSVVLVETSNGSGTGVCVGQPDVIVTNNHVVGDATEVTVTPFIQKDKDLIRMPKVSATVIFRSADDDVAVLRLAKAPEHLKPLPVATTDGGAGDKVYAIGCPGLGREVLEQSISEGLISTTKRKVDGKELVQHSAAVNPGNSGGPLLNENCQVVGLVTLKARLENVSFAVRVETLRRIFNSP